MNKIKYILVVAIAVFSFALWNSSFAANEWVEGTVEGGHSGNTFDASSLIGYRV